MQLVFFFGVAFSLSINSIEINEEIKIKSLTFTLIIAKIKVYIIYSNNAIKLVSFGRVLYYNQIYGKIEFTLTRFP